MAKEIKGKKTYMIVMEKPEWMAVKAEAALQDKELNVLLVELILAGIRPEVRSMVASLPTVSDQTEGT